VSLGIIGYLREEIRMPERIALFVLAFVMVIFPIGLSVEGLAPPAVGALLTFNHLRKKDRPASA